MLRETELPVLFNNYTSIGLNALGAKKMAEVKQVELPSAQEWKIVALLGSCRVLMCVNVEL